MTAFDHNPLAPLVLEGGRRLHALVGDPAKESVAERQINVALKRAMTGGWFGHLANTDKSEGRSVLPAVIPPHNMSQALRDDFQATKNTYESDDEGEAACSLEVAGNSAEEHGMEIKVDLVALSSRDFPSDFPVCAVCIHIEKERSSNLLYLLFDGVAASFGAQAY